MNERFEHREEGSTGHQQASGAQAREFASVEELIRHDAATTELPGTLEDRVKSSASEASPSKPWWRRLLGG